MRKLRLAATPFALASCMLSAQVVRPDSEGVHCTLAVPCPFPVYGVLLMASLSPEGLLYSRCFVVNYIAQK